MLSLTSAIYATAHAGTNPFHGVGNVAYEQVL